MDCPKCDGTLGRVVIKKRPEYGGDVLKDAEKTARIEVDQCLSCNGIWFDAGELDQYAAEKLMILNSPEVKDYKKLDAKTADCPKCHKAMARQPAPKLSSMTIDVCPECHGIWLDSSEIDRLEDKIFTFLEKHKLVFRNLKKLFDQES